MLSSRLRRGHTVETESLLAFLMKKNIFETMTLLSL